MCAGVKETTTEQWYTYTEKICLSSNVTLKVTSSFYTVKFKWCRLKSTHMLKKLIKTKIRMRSLPDTLGQP